MVHQAIMCYWSFFAKHPNQWISLVRLNIFHSSLVFFCNQFVKHHLDSQTRQVIFNPISNLNTEFWRTMYTSHEDSTLLWEQRLRVSHTYNQLVKVKIVRLSHLSHHLLKPLRCKTIIFSAAVLTKPLPEIITSNSFKPFTTSNMA